MCHITFFCLIAGFYACGTRSGTGENSEAPDLKNVPAIDSTYLNLCAKSFGHGLRLFKAHCHTCHAMPHEEALDSYTFDAYFERVPKPAEAYFIRYVSNSKVLRKSGDAYASKVHQDYSSTYEHLFKDTLGEKDLNDLIFYIKLGVKLKHLD